MTITDSLADTKGVSKKLGAFLQDFRGYYLERIKAGENSRHFADDLMKYFYTSPTGRELRKTLETTNVLPERPVQASTQD